MAWYHAQFTTRRFNPYTPNPVSLATLPSAGEAPTPTNASKELLKADSLFGPNIGAVEAGPAWTGQAGLQPKRLVEADELTTDTVRAWIEKSKLPTTKTTTLQAQVNLRRPTLRLSPLHPDEGVNIKDAPHLLEFAFDCATPKCGVHVHVLLPPGHPDTPPHGGALRVFESVVDGGFARALGPADAAVIELARFERMPATTSSPAPASVSVPVATAATPAPERKRFTPFHRRRAAPTATGAGAALAVVDAAAGDKKDDDDDKGVRVTIRLIALDAHGRELDAPNEQTVYLVVGRLGAPTATATTPAATPAAAPAEGEASKEKEADEDTRPWLVRVVKREATIGPHTFHLHEIYGLSSAAAAPAPAPTSATTTYPPQAPADDPPERECLLCLSSPREVVLLPCRHLVACRPCALNMVEFGAGGVIVPEADAAAGADTNAASPPEAAPNANAVSPPNVAVSPPAAVDADVNADAEAASPAEGDTTSPANGEAPAPAPATAPTTTRQRKRKAKGWFCPVCRQPYTSLLRITTAPPPVGVTAPTSPASPAAPGAPEEESANANASGGGGLLGGLSGLRPAFLRGLSTRGRGAGDVEAQL